MPALVMSILALSVCIKGSLIFFFREKQDIVLGLLLLVASSFAIWHTIPIVRYMATPQSSDLAAERYGPILSWLDTHTKTDDVVYTDEHLAPYVPAYTRDNVYFAPAAYLSYMPNAEIFTRYLGAHYFDRPFMR